MKTSRTGIDLIKKWEGVRLDAYADAVGVWTIGFGHTAMAGPPKPVPGMKITRQEAEDILIRDLVKYETAVANAITRPATQNQFDAMTSLCFNIGPGNFAKSTLVKLFNVGDMEGAANAFSSWRKAGGKVLQGLVNRRADEEALFRRSGGSSPIPPPPVPPDIEQPPAPAPAAPRGILKAILDLIASLFRRK